MYFLNVTLNERFFSLCSSLTITVDIDAFLKLNILNIITNDRSCNVHKSRYTSHTIQVIRYVCTSK